jgi:NADH:ubiquinone reductase (H+-translocating)
VPTVRDLFREGLHLGESLARLPWEAARRLTGGKSETLKTAADLGERLGTLPFRAARAAMGPGEGAGPSGPAGPAGAAKPEARGRTGGGRRSQGHILVLGAGYAGLTAFLELQERLSRDWDLTLVNGDRYHWFTTELHTYVAGEDENAVRIPLSRVMARPGRLVVDRVTGVDMAARQVALAGGRRLSYDYLLFALGSDPEYFGLPGVAENALIVGSWQGATKLRERIAGLVEGATAENARRVVVAGGGLTGVEVAAELADEYGSRLSLTIVEAGPDIMAGFAPDLVRTAREVLQSKGVAISAGNPITSVEPGLIHFKDGTTLPEDVLIWAGGVRGSALLAAAGLTVTRRGRAKVDPYLRAVDHPEIYVVGDSASFTDPATGRELPPTGQAAVQMGRAAGRNLLHRVRGQAEEPFLPKLKGAFASLGRTEGVGQIGEEQFKGVPAMMIKHLIESHHAWETGGGVMPLVNRLLRAPQRFIKGAARTARPRVAAHTEGRSEGRFEVHPH